MPKKGKKGKPLILRESGEDEPQIRTRDFGPPGAEKEETPEANPRQFTDILCWLVFIGYLVAMGFILDFAKKHGDIRKLTHGFNWEGKICGVDENYTDSPLLYWCASGLESGGLTITDGICVDSCPTDSTTSHKCPLPVTAKDFHSTSKKLDSGDTVFSFTVDRTLQTTNDMKTEEVLGMYCFPTENAELMAQVVGTSSLNGYAQRFLLGMHGIYESRRFLTFVAVMSFIAGYCFLYFLRDFAKPIILSMLIIVGAGLTMIFLYFGAMAIGKLGPFGDYESKNIFANYYPPEKAKKYALISTGVSGVIVILYVCVSMRMKRAIDVAFACIKESTEIMTRLPTLLIQPLVDGLLKVAVIVISVYGVGWVASLGQIHTAAPFDDPNTGLSISGMKRELSFTTNQWYMIGIWAFGGIWLIQVVHALGEFAISHAVVEDTFLHRKTIIPLARGYTNGLTFHLGSIAFGGFIIGVLQVFTMVASYVAKQTRDKDGNKTAAAMCCCMGFCLGCCEQIMQAANELIYVDIAIDGTYYMEAGYNVFKMFLNNPAVFALVQGSSRYIRNLGLATIGGGGTWLSYNILKHRSELFSSIQKVEGQLGANQTASAYVIGSLQTSDIMFTTIAAGLICFGIAAVFMMIFGHTSATLCYCILWKEANGILDEEKPESWKQAQETEKQMAEEDGYEALLG